MAGRNEIKNYTAAEIEKYHRGLLSAKERHAIEKAALDDPFLADALEGYAFTRNIQEEIAALKNQLSEKTTTAKVIPVLPGKSASFSWWKAAAMIVLTAGAGLLVYQFGIKNKPTDIARLSNEKINLTEEAGMKTDSSPGAGEKNKSLIVPKPEQVHDSSTITVKSKNGNLAATEAQSEKTPLKNKAEIKENNAGHHKVLVTIKEVPSENKATETAAPVQMNETDNASIISEKQETKISAEKDQVAVLNRKTTIPGNATEAYVKKRGPELPYRQFRGRVTDIKNTPLPFSNITNLEDQIGTYTDAQGFFTLTSPDSILNIQVRSLGFETHIKQIKPGVSENKIILTEDKSIIASVLDTVKRNANRVRTTTMLLEEPEPLDGWSNYDIYLANNRQLPETFKTKQTGGEVELMLEVNKKGEPVHITVKKSLCDRCDQEAIRLVKEGPKWKRKLKNGKATVTVLF